MEPKFKINDKVETDDNLIGIIDDIRYDTENRVVYYVSFIVDGKYYSESQLKPYVKTENQNNVLTKISNIIKDRSRKREVAIELINAYFDGKDIIMRDPVHGVKNWVSIHDPNYWSYLGEFIKEVDKYRIVK